MAIYHPLTGYEPNVTDDFHYSETSAMLFQDESGDMDTEPSYLCYADLDDEIIGISAVFTTVYSGARRTSEPETSLSLSSRKFVVSAVLSFAHARAGRPVHELSSCQKRKSSREMENERIRILLERQKEQILAEVRTVFKKHEFQADSDGRSIQELNGIVESQRREIDHTTAGDEQLRRDQLLLQKQLSEQNLDLREADIKCLHVMEELSSVQELRVDEFSRRRLIQNQDTIDELTATIQELQNEVNCMNDSREFKDAESVRSGLSHVPSQPALLPPFRDPGGMLSRSVGMPSRNDRPPDIWDTHGISGNVFCKSNGVFSGTLSAGIESMEFRKSGNASLIDSGEE